MVPGCQLGAVQIPPLHDREPMFSIFQASLVVGFAPISHFADGRVFAYLDPGTGSFVFQLLIAGVLSGLYAMKDSWRSIKAAVTTSSKTPGSDGNFPA
jgi:hypothetical protein